jgi:hypothetical protein
MIKASLLMKKYRKQQTLLYNEMLGIAMVANVIITQMLRV